MNPRIHATGGVTSVGVRIVSELSRCPPTPTTTSSGTRIVSPAASLSYPTPRCCSGYMGSWGCWGCWGCWEGGSAVLLSVVLLVLVAAFALPFPLAILRSSNLSNGIPAGVLSVMGWR